MHTLDRADILGKWYILANMPKLQRSSLNVCKHLAARCQQMQCIDTNNAMNSVNLNDTTRLSTKSSTAKKVKESIQPLRMQFDLNLNLLNQYPQTQPVASKEKTRHFIHKRDTQKKPNLTKSATDVQICVTRLPRWHKVGLTQLNIRSVPRGSQEDARDTKSPQSHPSIRSPDGCYLAPKGATERLKKTSEMTPSPNFLRSTFPYMSTNHKSG